MSLFDDKFNVSEVPSGNIVNESSSGDSVNGDVKTKVTNDNKPGKNADDEKLKFNIDIREQSILDFMHPVKTPKSYVILLKYSKVVGKMTNAKAENISAQLVSAFRPVFHFHRDGDKDDRYVTSVVMAIISVICDPAAFPKFAAFQVTPAISATVTWE